MSNNEFDISYKEYLAEKEMLNIFIREASILLNASDDVEITLESLEDTISRYIDKVTANIQKSWDKFKSKVGNDKQLKYLNNIQKTIATSNPKFMINNFPNYDLQSLMQIKVIPFDYANQKKQLKSKQQFIKDNYPNLVENINDPNNKIRTNMDKAVERFVVKGYTDTLCDKKVLLQIYQFCIQSYQELAANIEEDLQIINQSNTNIMNSVNIASSTTQEAAILYESMILEAPTNANNSSDKKSMAFTDTSGETTDPNDKKSENLETSYAKAVSNYMKVSTDIISAKMSLINDIYSDYMNIIEHYVKNREKNSRNNNNTNNPAIKENKPKQVRI